jgi:hypothetical protein
MKCYKSCQLLKKGLLLGKKTSPRGLLMREIGAKERGKNPLLSQAQSRRKKGRWVFLKHCVVAICIARLGSFVSTL